MRLEIPNEVKLKFDPIQIEGLSDKMFRVIWAAISVWHIRDQYFSVEVYDFVYELKKEWPIDRAKFINNIRSSSLSKYGTKPSGGNRVMDIDFWIRIYDIIYYSNLDIKLIYEPDD